jgi:hypothetical protein
VELGSTLDFSTPLKVWVLTHEQLRKPEFQPEQREAEASVSSGTYFLEAEAIKKSDGFTAWSSVQHWIFQHH